MLCPVCKVDLQMADREGVEIDFCPKCRGIWLDRGELDKIIERSSIENSSPSPAYREQSREYDDDNRHDKKKKKRGSFLGELFDF